MSQSMDRLSHLSPEEKRKLLADLLLKQAGGQIETRQTETAPLSSGQERMWLLEQLAPGNSGLNIPLTMRLTGRLDVAALQTSVNAVVRRHGTCRTSIQIVNGDPVQVVAPDLTVALPVVDLCELDATERQEQARQRIDEVSNQPFDLAQAPLLRALLLQTGRDQYLFHLTLHHSIADGWSLGVLLRELSVAYTALSSGQPLRLPDLPIQYADFARWQRQWLAGPACAGQLDYWRQQLANSPQQLELPTDHPRPPVQTFRSGHHSHSMPARLSRTIKSLGQREGATMFMTLLAAFQILLSRYSGQTDIPVGSPIAGRPRTDTEGLIGVFINMLVLRTDLGGNPSFRELLGRVRRTALEAYANQDVPFEKLLEELQPPRDPAYTPFFQVLFNMLNFDHAPVALPELDVEVSSPPEIGSNFDLTLYGEERDGALRLLLVYNADLFTPERIAELANQYEFLLEQIAENPDGAIADYDLLTPAARTRIPDPTLPLGAAADTVNDWRALMPERPIATRMAVIDSYDAWTRRELDTRSNQLAHYLVRQGIRPHDVVAVYGHRSASLVWALLGILRAGAAFTILDPAYPAARLVDRLRVAGVQAWLQLEPAGALPPALGEFLERLAAGRRVVLPRRAQAAQTGLFGDMPADAPGVDAGPDPAAYVAFTSGTTGQPKGILGTLAPLAHFLEWHTRTFELVESDRFCLLSGLAHDPLLRDIFTPLWLGATLYIPEQEQVSAPGQLARWMKEQEITVAHLTPTLGQILTLGDPDPVELASLRYAFFGGEALNRQQIRDLARLAPQATCVNFYGATETPQAMGYAMVPRPAAGMRDGEDSTAKQTIPLGRGIQDVQLLILNTAGHLAGIGELGEIHVRTPYLTRGYVGDDALTGARFVVNPFTRREEDRVYKTGDLARYLPDGTVEFAGRTDQQVKIRGFRIELGEIQAALCEHPAVEQAVVMARADGSGSPRLVAYVVPRDGRATAAAELRQALKERLPEYMLPAAFVTLAALPVTPNGKVDRQALPAPDALNAVAVAEAAQPRTPTEQMIAAIWCEALGVPQVGVYDNFFDLGGHSLSSVQVMTRLAQETGVKLNPALIRLQTLGQLATACDEAVRGDPADAARPESKPASRSLFRTLRGAFGHKGS